MAKGERLKVNANGFAPWDAISWYCQQVKY